MQKETMCTLERYEMKMCCISNLSFFIPLIFFSPNLFLFSWLSSKFVSSSTCSSKSLKLWVKMMNSNKDAARTSKGIIPKPKDCIKHLPHWSRCVHSNKVILLPNYFVIMNFIWCDHPIAMAKPKHVLSACVQNIDTTLVIINHFYSINYN